MRTLWSQFWMLLAVGLLLGCAKTGDVPRLEKSVTSVSETGKSASSSNSTSGPQVYWMNGSRGALPSGAIPMGTLNGKDSYLCRANVGSALLLGPVTADGSCIVPSNGSTFYSDTFEVLSLQGGVDANVVLADVNPDAGKIPENAVHGGAEYDFETFVCRVLADGKTYVGKTRAGYAGCLYFDGISENAAAVYAVLALR